PDVPDGGAPHHRFLGAPHLQPRARRQPLSRLQPARHRRRADAGPQRGGGEGLAALLSRRINRLVQGTRAIAEGNFDVTLAVTSRDEIGALTESFNQMARSLREKEMIKRAFTRYVAREVVEEILKNPENLVLTGERREVTVLFC